ncbi:MAG: phosphogluconate dehydrogenase (NADP(+)-dependent, decarboxylating) [Coxiella sp. (in: Bacteria)]|nr:MAG: phosphogluconate dehydrogenase (NADP(+)-dependent, decarboxylating) [Coxiella sp. (in: g-proteobacteria)]
MVGLGVMGSNFLLNMADNGYSVAGYDTDTKKADNLRNAAEARSIHATDDIKDFIAALRTPRAIMMLVPAGAPVDSVVKDLLPHLEKGDLIIDAGNSYFKDTERRQKELEPKGIGFLGVGVSGGEEGARHGPSMMPGGAKKDYERVQKIYEAASAHIEKDPCVTYLGPGSAGHFVKMVHNGIEYGIIQLIAETYDLMKRSLGLSNAELHKIYTKWNKEKLNGYLMEITSVIFAQKDDKTKNDLIDEILPVAAQNGTGLWTSLSALELNVPTPTINVAVTMRDMSCKAELREKASKVYKRAIEKCDGNKDECVKHIGDALYAAIIICYAQGMALLSVASKEYKYNFNMESVARIWRGGCIIRSTLLEDIMSAYRADNNLENFLLNPAISKKVIDAEEGLRKTIAKAVELGCPVPALSSTLGYLDALRSEWAPANLIQAQRDFFGSHTYHRIDDPKGVYHTLWGK